MTPKPRSTVRGALVAAVLGALAVAVHVRFAPWGFNPTDDGYIVSQAARVLGGDVPHADLISPRPLGSAYLHVIDVLLPLPLYESTRLVFVVQVTAMTTLFAWFALRRPPWTWGPLAVAATAAAVLVDIHVFPLMPWHTVDGLTMLAAGLIVLDSAALRSPRWWPLAAAFALLGAAPLMKQSFFAAPVIGAVWLVWSRRRDPRRLVRELPVAVAAAAAPALVYVAVVAIAGGIGAMVTQLTESARVPGWPPRDGFRDDAARREQLVLLLARLAAGLAAIRVLDLLAARWRAWWPTAVAAVPRLLAVAVVVRVVTGEHLVYGWTWGSKLMWALGLVAVLRSLLWWRFEARALTVFAAALMSTLSWGYAVPNLVAGVVALTLGELFLRDAVPSAIGARGRRGLTLAGGAAIGLAALLAVAPAFVDARRGSTYFDRDETGLTERLAPADGDFGRVRTNPVTAAYVNALVDCIDEHPARSVAVLPDNPGLYPALGLDSPFPIDWPYPPEVVGSEDRLVEAAERLAARGDYLVLFQTVDAFALRDLAELPDATVDSPPFFHGTDLGTRIMAALDGERVACGPFVGVHQPKRVLESIPTGIR